MSLVRIDVRIKSSLHEKIKQYAVDEGKKESEMIRELIDIGIAYKDAKKNPSEKQLSAFEEEVLKKLCSLTAASNKIITNQIVFPSQWETVQDARVGLRAYFEFYNHERLHQSLNYKTPWSVYHG